MKKLKEGYAVRNYELVEKINEIVDELNETKQYLAEDFARKAFDEVLADLAPIPAETPETEQTAGVRAKLDK